MRYIKKILLFAFFSTMFSACSSVPMDDLFGIEMPPESAKRFKIVSFSPEIGASYTSDFTMNPHVYAYAALRVEEVLIKVVNDSPDTLRSNYNHDEFYMIMKNGDVYVLRKGERENYPQKPFIAPGESRQFKLYLPKNFWETLGMTKPFKNYTYEMWAGSNDLAFYKEDVAQIKIVLGAERTLILKPLPEKE